MHRFPLAALVGALAIVACSEQSQPTPTEANRPAARSGGITSTPCPPATSFPITNVVHQIKALFPGGSLRDQGTSQASGIRDAWQSCQAATAQAGVGTLVSFIIQKYQAGALVGGISPTTAANVNILINTLYTGVGLAAPNLPIGSLGAGGDVGSGLFIPGTQKLIKTLSGNAAALIPANGFNVPTLITIIRLLDGSNPLNPPEGTPQFPPFYDVNASNASDHPHVLDNAQLAIIGFCVGDISALSDPQIGHKRFDGVFEILDPASGADYASLGLNCTVQGNGGGGSSLGSRNEGVDLKGLALRAWNAASQRLRPVAEAVLLPEPLHAATMLGGTGLGGRTSSFSPFGVVDAGSF